MPRFRRTAFLFFYARDALFLDLARLLRGVAETTSAGQIVAVSLVTCVERPLEADELRALLEIPSDRWAADGDVGADPALLRTFAREGLVLSDEEDELLAELRRRDELLASSEWSAYAALYHFMSRWRDVDVTAALPNDMGSLEELPAMLEGKVEEFLRHFGRPPAAFHSASAVSQVCELPLVEKTGGLYDALLRRATTRTFDRTKPMTAQQLSLVLSYTYGCHGYSPVADGLVVLRKTSPSGGGLHPIEVYPLVTNVEGIEPGLYHYAPRNHSLELIERLSREEAADAAREFTCKQPDFCRAHALFVMTGRFYRSFWKYRGHDKAYAVLLMDAGHLSQTLYLVCTELGLGAFVTAAVNNANIEERLGLDGLAEGVIAICGCGVPAEARSIRDPEFLPYVPRETTF